jgi:ribosomal protein L17
MANPTSRGQQRDKPFRDALRLAIANAEGNTRSLRRVAEQLVDKAMGGDVQAIKEVADRLDGKVPQAVVGDDEFDPVKMIITGVPRAGD